jgi:hypothetical protein
LKAAFISGPGFEGAQRHLLNLKAHRFSDSLQQFLAAVDQAQCQIAAHRVTSEATTEVEFVVRQKPGAV